MATLITLGFFAALFGAWRHFQYKREQRVASWVVVKRSQRRVQSFHITGATSDWHWRPSLLVRDAEGTHTSWIAEDSECLTWVQMRGDWSAAPANQKENNRLRELWLSKS